MRIPGTSGPDTRHGTIDNDEIYGFGGDDHLYGGDGVDSIFGGDDNDHLYGEGNTDYLWGDDGSDYLYGGGGNYYDFLDGGNGDDHLYGGGGGDQLYGGDGNDWLHGGDGADSLDGGDGVDSIFGDTAAYGDSDAAVLVSLVTGRGFGGDAEGDTLVNIENLSGSTGFGDWLIGDDHNNVLSGLGGDDTLWGYGGSDRLEGGQGNDTLNGGGNGVFLDEWGLFVWNFDELSGGPGADKFVFSSIDDIGNSTIAAHPADRITDFNPAEGDQINLHPIDADDRPEAPGNQDFSTDLVPEGVAFTRPGQISWQHVGGETWITLNTDADSFAEATIHVHGSYTPDPLSWFVF
jgi:Ca2+-binding RTX toxin-like protein